MNTVIHRTHAPRDVQRDAFIKGAVHAFVLIAFMVLVEAAIYHVLIARITVQMDNAQWLDMKGMTDRLTTLLARQESDFLIVGKSKMAQDCLLSQTPESCQPAISLMQTAMTVDENIDHVRLINKAGREVVRINREHDNRLMVVPDAHLQNKKHRLYFKEAMKTRGGQIYVSRIELNMENEAIETPPKPIVRLGKAVQADNGDTLGCLVTNYRVRRLIKEIEESVVHPEERWYLLNMDGYYLHADQEEKEFAFMYADRSEMGFFSDHPSAWEHYHRNPSVPVVTTRGKFYLSPVSAAQAGIQPTVPRSWILVKHVSPATVFATGNSLLIGLIIGAVLISPILAMLGWRNGNYGVLQKWYLHELATNATTDHLTGLLNHRGVMEKLEPAVSIANRRGSPLTLVFIDVNNLKVLNDELGHEMGDRLIAGTADVLKQTLRQTDIVGRLGGDEFVVALIDCDWSLAETVMTRAEKGLAQKGIGEMGAPWTMSWGYAVREENDSASQMLSRADKQMYFHKRAFKTGQFHVSGHNQIES